MTLLALVLCTACEGSLTIQLLPPGFEDPYAEVSAFHVTLLDPSFVVVDQFATPAMPRTELGVVDAADGLVLRVEGLDSEQNVRASGESRRIDLNRDSSGLLLVPFAPPTVMVAVPDAWALSQALTVDGVLAEWIAPPSRAMDDDYRVAGPAVTPTDLRGEVFVAWDIDRLLFAVRVVDDCVTLVPEQSANDCPATSSPDRLGIGMDGTDDDTLGPDDFYILAQATGVQVLAGKTLTRDDLALNFGLLPEGRGWALEGRIRLGALGRVAISQRDRIGIEITIIDEDPSQEEPTVLRLSRQPGPLEQAIPAAQMGTLGFGAL